MSTRGPASSGIGWGSSSSTMLEVAHPSGGDQDTRLQRPDHLVVGLDGPLESRPHAGGVRAHRPQPVVESRPTFSSSRALAVRASCCQVKATVRSSASSAPGPDEDHPASHCLLVQAGVGRQRGGEHGLAGHEADDHLGRGLERRPVVLLGQGCDVGLQCCGVLAHQPLALAPAGRRTAPGGRPPSAPSSRPRGACSPGAGPRRRGAPAAHGGSPGTPARRSRSGPAGPRARAPDAAAPRPRRHGPWRR